MYESVANKSLQDLDRKHRLPDGPNKGTLVTFNVRKFNEEDYLQVLWEMEDHIALTQNFYLNSKDPKDQKRAHEKLNNLLMAVGVDEDLIKKGGFSDYDSLRSKRAYVFKKSFKNDKGEQISYIEHYSPLDRDSSTNVGYIKNDFGNSELPNEACPF